jgi:hypothetical protein
MHMLEQRCDLELREELEPIGRARRFRTDDDRAEIWRFSRSDEATANRLIDLGASRIGGFVRGGIDDDGVWLVRRVVASASADRSARPWREVIGIVHALAGALAACEKRALFPGPIRWSELSFDPPCIAAEPLVRAIVGAAAASTRTSADPSLKWTPPEQAAGAPWDSAANRYVLGLVAYRLIAGRHPYEGGGLRHAAQEQATNDAPPFEEEIARTLRPGVQSFVLRLLAADRSVRPDSARTIASQCEALLVASRKSNDARVAETSQKQAPLRSSAVSIETKRKRSLTKARPISSMSLAPVLVGGAAALVAFAARSEDVPVKPKIAPVLALADGCAEACGSCHAREVAEWSRSAMAFSAKSPLYGGLESLVEEQFAKSNDCPNGAGVLRNSGADACVDRRTGITITGTGGEDWCVNCHSPSVNLGRKNSQRMTPWSALGSPSSRAPANDLLNEIANEGVSCIACHTSTHGAGASTSAYTGNGQWRSPFTGAFFSSRPEDVSGKFGIANSAYFLDARAFFGDSISKSSSALDPIVHKSSTNAAREYRSSSEFCGACHDVRLFGTDAIGVRERGEHFKRLRNAYSEWRAWADGEERAGKKAATCQGCHMSLYPGSCEPGASSKNASSDDDCPSGTHFVTRAPGEMSTVSKERVFSHYFTSVDFPLAPAFPAAFIDDAGLDEFGVPLGMRARQRMLLKASFRFSIGDTKRSGGKIEIPIHVENIGAGHRIPAGFSQEREIWVELEVTDARGGVVYEVGKVESAKDDLRDKIFTRVSTSDTSRDFLGRPLGVFGADVVDGPDAPAWSPNPNVGGSIFVGKGLVNFQNGFLRCVTCIGSIDESGKCNAVGDQSRTRAGKFEDGAYDVDTGECRSNLSGGNEFFETYFPVGSLDADRGVLKAPDAIIDTRSAPPKVPLVYTYELETNGHPPPYDVHAKVHFRAFPPYLIRAFADYEAQQSAQGKRPNGPQVTTSMLDRLEVVDLADARARIE